MRRTKTLSREDRHLWASVARTTVPLTGKERPEFPEPDNAQAGPVSPRPETASASLPGLPGKDRVAKESGPKPKILSQHTMERMTRRKIAKGRIAIEARLDLHEMTQAHAHDALMGFLRQAQAMGMRHVLIITGRGSIDGSRGILRRMVPLWFASAPFRMFVTSFESAERHHGGEGALYVRIRRIK